MPYQNREFFYQNYNKKKYICLFMIINMNLDFIYNFINNLTLALSC